MPKHGTRISRKQNRSLSWRSKASQTSGELWDAKDQIAELEKRINSLENVVRRLMACENAMDWDAATETAEALLKRTT